MSELLVRANTGAERIVSVSPETAGWEHVGFDVLAPSALLELPALARRETCLVVIAGRCEVAVDGADLGELSRDSPFADLPDAAFVPAGGRITLSPGPGGAEVAVCTAPATPDGFSPRLIGGADVAVERRGQGSFEREVRPILMGEDPGVQRLLVCEVVTPPGHWSSFPPHKHDRDDPPRETRLEETYYHRINPASGFGLQRVYSDDRSLDETIAFGDRDTVLVPRGYHTVSAPPGCELYYLNVMAGPRRRWTIAVDPDHAAIGAVA